ncbi:MAG: aldehyde dehydrogenase family protein, partial [Proteobacteria bacterium]|nr:aldehyde dehydrogenase family protein [Pseudomonadota bacterium]
MTLPIMKNYINGEWVESNGTIMGDVTNPATGKKIAQVVFGTKDDVEKAVQAARKAFIQWRKTPPLTRARYIFRIKDAFEENFEEIAQTLTMENGKIIDEALNAAVCELKNVVQNPIFIESKRLGPK